MNKYEYTTSPRKYYPEYTPYTEDRKKKKKKKKNPVAKKKKAQNTISKQNLAYIEFKKKQQAQRRNNMLIIKQKLKVLFIIVLVMLLPLFILYRTSCAQEKFIAISKQKQEMEELQKENAQLNLGLQNTLSLNKIEEIARNRLGMSKIDSYKVEKIRVTMDDFVENSNYSVIPDKEESFFKKIYDKIIDAL